MEYGIGNADEPKDANGISDFTVTQNPFVFGPMSEARREYTGERVIERLVDADGNLLPEYAGGFKPSWASKVSMLKHGVFNGEDYTGEWVGYHGITPSLTDPDAKEFAGLDIRNGYKHVSPETASFKFVDAQGKTVGFAEAVDDGNGGVDTVAIPTGAVKVLYVYDNQTVPQEKLPVIRGRMKGISLEARARRLTTTYSQFMAFQSKTDYGMDFESTIAQQAQAELEYAIDSEAVELIRAAADHAVEVGYKDAIGLGVKDKAKDHVWIDEELDTISVSMKAEGFARKIEQAKMDVYRATGRFMPTWITFVHNYC